MGTRQGRDEITFCVCRRNSEGAWEKIETEKTRQDEKVDYPRRKVAREDSGCSSSPQNYLFYFYYDLVVEKQVEKKSLQRETFPKYVSMFFM